MEYDGRGGRCGQNKNRNKKKKGKKMDKKKDKRERIIGKKNRRRTKEVKIKKILRSCRMKEKYKKEKK